MNLRFKTLLIVGTATLGLGTLALTAAYFTFDRNSRHVEELLAAGDLARARQALTTEIEQLQETNRYWAIWDDAYQFALDLNPRFIEVNLYDTVLRESRVDLILFLDPECRLLYGKTVSLPDRPQGAQVESARFAFCEISRRASLPEAASGVLVLPEGPFLVSALPILTSKREGPRRGTLLVGRAVDARVATRLRHASHLDLTLIPASARPLPPGLERVAEALPTPESSRVQRLSESELAGYARFDDLAGEPALFLRAWLPREAYARGVTLLRGLALFVVALGVLVCLAILLLLDRSVLVRLTALVLSVRDVGWRRDLSRRVPVRGRDEIAALAIAINETLAALERSQR